MALFTITTEPQVNLPPSQLGFKSINMAHNATYVFTLLDFTDTAPPYEDPEGDVPSLIKIVSLPTAGTGVLYLNGVAVVANEDISVANINSGLLTYVADIGTVTSYSENITFDIADVGSGTFSGLTGGLSGLLILNIAAKENLPPNEVGDGEATIDYGETLVFTRAMFTTGTTPVYADPEGDAADLLKILTLPSTGQLVYNGFVVVVNQIIPFSDIDLGLLTYVPTLADTDGNIENFTFSIADVGSGQFTV